MIKIKGKLNFSDKDLEKYVRDGFNSAVEKTVAKTANRIQEQAGSRLKGGMKKWEKGFSIDQLSNDTFVLTLSGKLASMMEDGIGVGEISKMIMEGNRANYNRAEGKNYVDVPIPKPEISSVQVFRDADSLMSHFSKKKVKFSDIKNKGVRQEDRQLRRVKDLIESKKTMDSDSQFLVIKRVTENSIWPARPFAGAKAFESGSTQIASDFEDILRKVL